VGTRASALGSPEPVFEALRISDADMGWYEQIISVTLCIQIFTCGNLQLCTEKRTLHDVRGATMTTVPSTELREKLSDVLDDVDTTGTEYTITRHGRPVAVVVSYDEYEAMIETLNILSDAETMAAIAEGDEDLSDRRDSER
jgi:antitoxin YefM